MRRMVFTFVVLLILPLVSFSHAQFGKSRGPSFRSDFNPVVGGWSEYQMKAKGEAPSKMKIAIVGKEGDGFWYESVMEGQREGRMITKMLVSGNPEDQKNLKRMIVKMGNEPAMEMPLQMMGQGPASKSPVQKGKMIDKGTESIKAPAGTFTTRHMQYQDPEGVVDTWVFKDITPYGMVKSQSKDLEMVLVGYGTGAKTLITEQPQKFEMPQMPKGMPKGFQKAPAPGDDDEEEEEEDDDDDNDDDDDDDDGGNGGSDEDEEDDDDEED